MSSYTITAIGVSLLLVFRLRFGTWGLLRIALLIHLLGDVFFGPLWAIMPTYAWARYIADVDRERAALFLAAAVGLTDVGYRLSGWFFRAARGAAAQTDVAPQPPGRQSDASLGTPPTTQFAASFLVVGFALKLVFLAATGVLTGARRLADLRPEDSLGLSGFLMISDFLIPYGLAALRRARGSARVDIDLIILAIISYFSFSKAAFISYLIVYGVAFLLAFGRREVRRQFLNWRLAAIVVFIVVMLGIKTQQRSGTTVDMDSDVLADQALLGASARFMGGIYRAYTVTFREISAGWPPLGGAYHAQALLLPVPRFLWPGKPRVASEQLYHLLGVTEEAYGTAFAVNTYGAMVFDFGIQGTLIAAVVFGLLLRVGDERIPSWRALRNGIAAGRSDAWHYFATVWLFATIHLSEGGIPIAIVSTGILAVVYVPIARGNRALYRVLALASGPSLPIERGPGDEARTIE